MRRLRGKGTFESVWDPMCNSPWSTVLVIQKDWRPHVDNTDSSSLRSCVTARGTHIAQPGTTINVGTKQVCNGLHVGKTFIHMCQYRVTSAYYPTNSTTTLSMTFASVIAMPLCSGVITPELNLRAICRGSRSTMFWLLLKESVWEVRGGRVGSTKTTFQRPPGTGLAFHDEI